MTKHGLKYLYTISTIKLVLLVSNLIFDLICKLFYFSKYSNYVTDRQSKIGLLCLTVRNKYIILLLLCYNSRSWDRMDSVSLNLLVCPNIRLLGYLPLLRMSDYHTSPYFGWVSLCIEEGGGGGALYPKVLIITAWRVDPEANNMSTTCISIIIWCLERWQWLILFSLLAWGLAISWILSQLSLYQ